MHATDVAVPWFTCDDYDAIRLLVRDRNWRDNYSDWLDDAQQAIRGLEAKGVEVVKAHVHADTFAVWCRLTERPTSAAALQEFAYELAGKAYRNSHVALDR